MSTFLNMRDTAAHFGIKEHNLKYYQMQGLISSEKMGNERIFDIENAAPMLNLIIARNKAHLPKISQVKKDANLKGIILREPSLKATLEKKQAVKSTNKICFDVVFSYRNTINLKGKIIGGSSVVDTAMIRLENKNLLTDVPFSNIKNFASSDKIASFEEIRSVINLIKKTKVK